MKKYHTVRFSNSKLFDRARKRAIDEKISLLELLESAVSDYLKKPIDKDVSGDTMIQNKK